ncbi:hypothetical protein TNCV_2041341 [Trichonephila clavipes]|nr:hypothetical protein TNCV_2041341 [Trichonephila clavipes]
MDSSLRPSGIVPNPVNFEKSFVAEKFSKILCNSDHLK